MRALALTLATTVFFSGCARAPLKDRAQALRPTSAPELSDDLPLEPLFKAIETEIALLEKAPIYETFVFGERKIPKAEYLAALTRLVAEGRKAATPADFFKVVERDWQFYEVNGEKGWSEAFVTSYYEPVVAGSKKRTARFTRPLYRAPNDLVSLDLTLFNPEKYALDRKWRGRVVDATVAGSASDIEPQISKSPFRHGQASLNTLPAPKKLIPYYARAEIDSDNVLKGRKLELVWVDPLDAFVIQIQGSGTIDLGGGKSLRVGVEDKNGRDYEPLGKFLRDFIPKDQMSIQAIERTMRSFPPEKQQEYMNKNPSYIFFKPVESATAYLGVPATDGRTAAVDHRFFPKGALAFLMTTKPKWSSADEVAPKEWQPLSRFVLDQDIGGAITGGGRLDLYWGSGDEAKRNAGVMRQPGKLYYLAPKPEQKP